MARRVQVELFCSTQASANNVRTNLLDLLASRPTLSGSFEVSQPGGVWTVTGSILFTSAAHADEVLAAVRSRWSSGAVANRILAGSTARWHDCSHEQDRDGSVCVDAERVVK